MKGFTKVCMLLRNTPRIIFVTVPINETQPHPTKAWESLGGGGGGGGQW